VPGPPWDPQDVADAPTLDERISASGVDSWDIFDSFPDHVEQDGRLVSLPQWHREGLRDLCLRLFGQRSTRAVRAVMSSAFRQLGKPAGDGPPDSTAVSGAVKPG
jgi:hypothetical protein